MSSRQSPQYTGSIRPSKASRRRSKNRPQLAVMQALENRLLLDGAPPTPTGLTHSPLPAPPDHCPEYSCSSTLSWSGAYNAGDTAHLEVSTDGLNWVETQTSDATTHQLVVNYLNTYPEYGPTYRFRVRVNNTSGYSSYSNIDTLAQNVHPMKPYNVYAERTATSGQIHLHWDGDFNTNPQDAVHIQQSTDDVNFTDVQRTI